MARRMERARRALEVGDTGDYHRRVLAVLAYLRG
jgi:hypothetical protein